MYTIRGLRESDSDAVREVCVSTAAERLTDTPRKRLVLWDLYCDYYVKYARDTSFVAVDDNDRAIGYVFCAPDYAEYERIYRKEFLPVLTKHNRFKAIIKRINLRGDRVLSRGRPAHLHIDIIGEAQRQGLGHKLVDALVVRLDELGVPKVFLTVSAGNVKGVNFYTKYGFTRVQASATSILFDLNISEKSAEIMARNIENE